jgi:hypothetical protein
MRWIAGSSTSPVWNSSPEVQEPTDEPGVSAHFLADLPGHLPRSDDQDILFRRIPGNVDLEQNPPKKKESGCDQDAEIIHLSRNAELRDGVGKQADTDAYEPDRDRQCKKHFPPALGKPEIVEIEKIHACLTEKRDH